MDIDWSEAIGIVPRGFISLVALFIITKIIGKKQVSELSLFDYVIGISIGNFGAEMTLDIGGQYFNGIVAIIVYGLVAYLVSIISMKSMALRRLLIGEPTMIIQEGKIIEKNMKKTKLDVNDLLEQCRSDGYFDIGEINYAVLEANGKLSVELKSEYKPVTPKDMNIKAKKEGLTANIIIDGVVMKKILKNMHKDEEWLYKELKIKGYSTLNNILLATLSIDDKLTIYEKNKSLKPYDVLE